MSDAAVPMTTNAAAGGATSGVSSSASVFRQAKFTIGDVVKHRVFPFRGVVFDVDPVFDNTEEWLASIPEEVRPHKDQPFYHLLAENDDTTYVAYVSEQNLLADETGKPCRHPLLREMFMSPKRGVYRMRAMKPN
jgi:heat shock protein HspQ